MYYDEFSIHLFAEGLQWIPSLFLWEIWDWREKYKSMTWKPLSRNFWAATCNSQGIRILEEFNFTTLFKLRTLYLVKKFCCSRPSIIIPLLLVSSDTAKKCVTVKAHSKEGPTWRCCQPKTKFICHTMWNISDEVIHMSVKIKMSPWTRPNVRQSFIIFLEINIHDDTCWHPREQSSPEECQYFSFDPVCIVHALSIFSDLLVWLG